MHFEYNVCRYYCSELIVREDVILEICIENLPEKNVEKLTPKMVRRMLGIDNKEIADLCRQISLIPKKDAKGQTYFSKDDVNVLQKIKCLHDDSISKMKQEKVVNYMARTTQNSQDTQFAPIQTSSNGANELISTFATLEKKMLNKIAKVIDEKLDGMDEVVVELIRCKTENEALRQKINELNKELYNAKNEMATYKPVAFNWYVKQNNSF